MAIGCGVSPGNLLQRVPDGRLELGADGGEWQLERPQATLEIGLQLLAGIAERLVVEFAVCGKDGTLRRWRSGQKLDAAKPGFIGCEQKISDW